MKDLWITFNWFFTTILLHSFLFLFVFSLFTNPNINTHNRIIVEIFLLIFTPSLSLTLPHVPESDSLQWKNLKIVQMKILLKQLIIRNKTITSTHCVNEPCLSIASNPSSLSSFFSCCFKTFSVYHFAHSLMVIVLYSLICVNK